MSEIADRVAQQEAAVVSALAHVERVAARLVAWEREYGATADARSRLNMIDDLDRALAASRAAWSATKEAR